MEYPTTLPSPSPTRTRALQGSLLAGSSGASCHLYRWVSPSVVDTEVERARATEMPPAVQLLVSFGAMPPTPDEGSAGAESSATTTAAGAAGGSLGVNAVAFSPDGGYLATASDDGLVRVWRVLGAYALAAQQAAGTYDAHAAAAWKPVLVRVLRGHASAATGVAFHPGGNVLASSSRDGTVRVWEVNLAAAATGLAASALGAGRVVLPPDVRCHVITGLGPTRVGNQGAPPANKRRGGPPDAGRWDCRAVEFSTDGRWLFVLESSQRVRRATMHVMVLQTHCGNLGSSDKIPSRKLLVLRDIAARCRHRRVGRCCRAGGTVRARLGLEQGLQGRPR